MAPFESDTEVYESLGPLLTDLVRDAGALAQLRRADAVVQYTFRHPDATITVDVREGRNPRVETGASNLRADLVLVMDADVGERLLNGELNPMLALARGELRTKGPVAKLLRVMPAVSARSGEPAEVEVAEGQAAAGAEGDATAGAEGDAAAGAEGDAAAGAEGDAAAGAEGDAAAEPVSTPEGDAEGTPEQGRAPEAGA
jgi:putative sterol carrier protein